MVGSAGERDGGREPADDDEQAGDPDADRRAGARRAETRAPEWDLLVACSAGGVLGSWARYGVEQAIAHPAGSPAWSTVVINVSGCLLIGVLMAVLGRLATPHRLLRPFLGVGVLGGYTTYSTFAVDTQDLLLHHRPGTAAIYVLATLVGCGAAVWAGSAVVGRVRP